MDLLATIVDDLSTSAMKRVPRFLVLVLIAVSGVTGVWLWLARTAGDNEREASQGVSHQTNDTEVTATAEAGVSNQPAVTPEDATLPSGLSPAILKQMAHARRRFAEMNGPIEFYAQLIDQHHAPVINATVRMAISRYSERLLDTLSADGMVKEERISANSDARGRFSIRREYGHSIRIEGIEREGYLWEDPGLGSFEYGTNRAGVIRTYADPAKGVTLHMWRKNATVPLIQIHRIIYLQEGKTEYPLNLFSNSKAREVAPTVDLLIKIPLATPEDTTRRMDRWVILEMPGGGIVESEDAYPYAAPEAGYGREWRKLFQPGGTGPNSQGWRRSFYQKARKGRVYAGLVIKFAQGMDGFEISGFINPHGTRNLEPDPAKQITDPEEIRRLDAETSAR